MKTLLLLLSLIFLSGCNSFIGIALESLTVSKTDDYFDLNGKQKDALKADVEKDMGKVRRNVFPQAARSLRDLNTKVAKDQMSPEMTAKIYTDFDTYFKQISTIFESTAVKTVSTLDDSQFKYFQKKIDREIEDSEDDTKTTEKAEKQSYKRYTKLLEFWFGDLTDKQEKELRGFIKDHPYPWALQNKNKKHVTDQFMASRKDPEVLKKFVSDYCKDFETARLPEFKTALSSHETAFQNYFAQTFWPSIDQHQKDVFRDRLVTRADELDKWARR